jgi:hypothetical protein
MYKMKSFFIFQLVLMFLILFSAQLIAEEDKIFEEIHHEPSLIAYKPNQNFPFSSRIVHEGRQLGDLILTSDESIWIIKGVVSSYFDEESDEVTIFSGADFSYAIQKGEKTNYLLYINQSPVFYVLPIGRKKIMDAGKVDLNGGFVGEVISLSNSSRWVISGVSSQEIFLKGNFDVSILNFDSNFSQMQNKNYILLVNDCSAIFSVIPEESEFQTTFLPRIFYFSNSSASSLVTQTNYNSASARIAFSQSLPFTDSANRPANINPGTVITTSGNGLWVVTEGHYYAVTQRQEDVYVYQEGIKDKAVLFGIRCKFFRN